jgi:hypothetical protein
MAITPLPTPPSRNDPSTFSALADAFLGALPAFATEANALATATNLNETNSAASAVTCSTKAAEAAASAGSVSISEANAVAAASSAQDSAELSLAVANLDFGSFSISDGELSTTYLDTAVSTPSIQDGDFIITY